MRVLEPARWKLLIETAMRKSNGGIPEAAEELGVCKRTLQRWLALPELAHIPHAPTGVYRDNKLGAMRINEPEKWKHLVETAMWKSNGAISGAAAELGVSANTLSRWLNLPELAGVKKK